MLMEVLKNSMSAVLEHWGKDIVDAPPIEVRISTKGNELGIRVSDPGGGIPVHRRPFVWNWCAPPTPSFSPFPSFVFFPSYSISFSSFQRQRHACLSLSPLSNGSGMPANLRACLPFPHAKSIISFSAPVVNAFCSRTTDSAL